MNPPTNSSGSVEWMSFATTTRWGVYGSNWRTWYPVLKYSQPCLLCLTFAMNSHNNGFGCLAPNLQVDHREALELKRAINNSVIQWLSIISHWRVSSLSIVQQAKSSLWSWSSSVAFSRRTWQSWFQVPKHQNLNLPTPLYLEQERWSLFVFLRKLSDLKIYSRTTESKLTTHLSPSNRSLPAVSLSRAWEVLTSTTQ